MDFREEFSNRNFTERLMKTVDNEQFIDRSHRTSNHVHIVYNN